MTDDPKDLPLRNHPLSDRQVLETIRKTTHGYPERMKAVMVYWLFAEKKMTFDEIGAELGITGARAMQIRNKALERLETAVSQHMIGRRWFDVDETYTGPIMNRRLDGLVSKWKSMFKPEKEAGDDDVL